MFYWLRFLGGAGGGKERLAADSHVRSDWLQIEFAGTGGSEVHRLIILGVKQKTMSWRREQFADARENGCRGKALSSLCPFDVSLMRRGCELHRRVGNLVRFLQTPEPSPGF